MEVHIKEEHGKKYCQKSITLEETKLQELICKGIAKAVESQKEVITGKQDSLNIYKIEHQIRQLDELRDETKNKNRN